MFNVLATIVIFGIPFLRELPLKGADKISDMAIKNKTVVAAYLVLVFVVMPGTILALTV
jgi:sodium-dependent phosphate cotransporter